MDTNLILNDIRYIKASKAEEWDYLVTWNINNICNFNCWFCSQGTSNNHDYNKYDINRYNLLASDIVKKINAELLEIHNKKIMIDVVGGEPTLSDLPYLIDTIEPNDNEICFRMATNFSCSQEYCDELYSVIESSDNKQLRINVSIHPETDMDEMIKKIERNIKYIKSVLIVIYDEESYNKYIDLKKSVSCSVRPQLRFDCDTGEISVPQEIIDKIDFDENKGRYFVVDNEGNRQYYQRYELMEYLSGENKAPILKGVKCLGKTRIVSDGRIQHCAYDEMKVDARIFEIEPRICPYDKYCNLCYPIKLEKPE